MARKFIWDGIWRFGGNFVPSTAINQLEMWQAESFDPETTDRELGWAHKIGMGTMRVFLHDLLWEQDAAGFIDRIDRFLKIAEKNGIKPVFVFFDDCWKSEFHLGKQPDPVPFTHNSGWIQSPGNAASDDLKQRPRLEKYVKGILDHFRHDERILAWDLYNEPGNGTTGDHITKTRLRANLSMPLLNDVFDWAFAVAPDQPVTAGLWRQDPAFDDLNKLMMQRSDIVSFHSYQRPDILEERCHWLRLAAAGRPIVCTEYMARTAGSTFKECLPVLKKHNITAINWGLVSGKTQTIYPWGWNAEKGNPDPYFHDVFRKDGSLLMPEEAEVFRQIMEEK